jgi:hypothetical protein
LYQYIAVALLGFFAKAEQSAYSALSTLLPSLFLCRDLAMVENSGTNGSQAVTLNVNESNGGGFCVSVPFMQKVFYFLLIFFQLSFSLIFPAIF